ncbi:MAG: nucleoside-diphosphate kinase [Candidatus Nanoarchaeia archaeon]
MGEVFVMLYFQGVDHSDEILTELDKIGRKVKSGRVDSISLEQIAAHYSDSSDKPWFNEMINDFVGQPALLLVYEGDPEEFHEAKIRLRKQYYKPSPRHRDAIHTSDSDRTAYEIDVWKDYLML